MLLVSIFSLKRKMLSSNLTWDNKTCKTRGMSHYGLAIYIKKSILRQKKNYGNSNISPCKNIIFKTNRLKKTKILQDIMTL
jgi:hypothetical protein